MVFSGQHGAPTIDAIGHNGGLNAEGHEGSHGLKSRGIEEYPSQRLVNRAVLLDVARYKCVSTLAPGQEITAEDLAATAKFQNVEIRPGDSCVDSNRLRSIFRN